MTTALVAVAMLTGAGCGGTTVNLGAQGPRPYHFGMPRKLAELGPASSQNPTLTGDLLEIFFTSERDGISSDVWTAHRTSTTMPFEGVSVVAEASTPTFETSSAISRDGLTLWVGSDRPGGVGDIDIWMLQRTARDAGWSTPVDTLAMNSPSRDVPRSPGQHDRVMPLSSERDDPNLYRTYFSNRDSPDSLFGPPAIIPELAFAAQSTVDGFLTDDGLALFYSSAPPMGVSDLFVAWRRSTSEPFSISAPLDELNTPTGDERDPWLSPDGQTLFFTSDHAGQLDIYEVAATDR
jgi:WD40-like Beta Propeller Repeat